MEVTGGETATLSLPGDREAITVDLRCRPGRGRRRQHGPQLWTDRAVSHATAVGKVMLAFGGGPLPRERDLVALTERTITDREALEAAVQVVRERGYATVFGEREPDVNSIAAPVWGHTDALAAILGIQGPATRPEDPTRLLAPLLEGAASLTRALGGRR